MGPLEFPAWDPVLLPLPGPIDVRWYGLMYIVGFVSGGWILGRLAKRGFLPIKPEQVGDLIFYCVIGTILGGRFGYAIFYDSALFDLGKLVRLWEGGLAFHGGLLGVMTALWIFARRHRVSVGRVLDSAALAVTPGILAVRFANFINGELYGRVTSADTPFAMRFPTDQDVTGDPFGMRYLSDFGGGQRARELMIQYAHGHVDFDAVLGELPKVPAEPSVVQQQSLDALRAIRWEDIAEQFPFRHPSQLYEAAGEGLVLGLALFVMFRLTRNRPRVPWTYGGLFAFGYGVIRTALENVRQPDKQFRDAAAGDELGTVLFGLTMGQVLSSVMIVGGLALLLRGLLRPGVREEAVA